MLRLVREEEPSKPSNRLNSLETLPSIAASRGLDPTQLNGVVAGELDWIAMKSLEKNRNLRYETASAFAADVQRYLNDEPVEACPPSTVYRWKKFARRHKQSLAVSLAAALVLVIGSGSLGWVALDRSARHAKLNYGIEIALHEANLSRERALSLTGNRAEWQAALSTASYALMRADELAAQHDAVDGGLQDQLESLHVALNADENDRQFVADFDDILGQVIVWSARRNQLTDQATFLRLMDVFRRHYGIEIDATQVAEAARLIQQRPDAIQKYFLAALNVWFARLPQDQPRAQRWLSELLRLSDGDDWRRQARAALQRSDWTALQQLLKSVDVSQQPPALLHLLSSYLPRNAWSTKQELFLQIQQNYPREVWSTRFGNALTHDILAWVMVTDSGSLIRDDKVAVELARQAVRLVPKDGDFWNTLGVAYYRNRQWRESAEALRTAIELSQGGVPADWLFLAMAEWQLGNKSEARRWYTQAVESQGSGEPGNDQLPAFRAEAEELMK
jgi:tetratricopeptide (TPR) repeat protein